MFDIGFWELALIGVVALLVIGPERLPSVARSAGRWVGKARQFVSYVQSDLKQEITKADELKKLMEQQAQIKEVHEIIEQTVSDARDGVSVGARLTDHEVKPFETSENIALEADANSKTNPDDARPDGQNPDGQNHDDQKSVTKTLNEQN